MEQTKLKGVSVTLMLSNNKDITCSLEFRSLVHGSMSMHNVRADIGLHVCSPLGVGNYRWTDHAAYGCLL